MTQLYSNNKTSLITISGTSNVGVWYNLAKETDTYNCFELAHQGISNDMSTNSNVEILFNDTTTAPSTSTYGTIIQVGDAVIQENMNPFCIWARTDIANTTILVDEYFKG